MNIYKLFKQKIILLLLLVSFANVTFTLLYFQNRSQTIVSLEEVASTQSMKGYLSWYLPGIINNLYTISILYENKSYTNFNDIDPAYLATIFRLVSATSALSAIIGIPSVYQDEHYLKVSVAINTFLSFIEDGQKDKIEYIAKNSQSFIDIFENLLRNLDNVNKTIDNCTQLTGLLRLFTL